MMVIDYDQVQLKDFMGYEIWKIWDITSSGKKVNVQYEVADEEDAIDFFQTLEDAKNYIKRVLA